VDELFRQAGVVRVDGLEELFDTAALLGYQPLPAGPRVAVVSNGGGPGILAADAAIAAGLDVPELSEGLQATLRELVPAGAAVRNPVDLVASAGAATFGAVLRELLDSPEIDAAIVIHVPTRGGRADEIESVIAAAARSGPKTVAVCLLARDEEHSALGRGSAAPVPTFAFPESAAAALGRAARLTAWRARPDGEVPQIDKVDCERARTLVDRRLALSPAGEWVDLPTTAEILGCFGVPVVASRYAATAQDAAGAAADLAVRVALKAAAPELVHKSDVGAVRLDLQTPDDVRSAFETMHEALGNRMGGAIVQPMVAPGVEVIVGITHDRLFGPLVLFGMGGFTAELLRDTALRILPVTDVDASEMVRSLRSSPLLFGYRDSPAVDVVALEDLLVHIGQLAEHIPEIVELDCNPVIVAAAGVTVVDAKMRIAPADGPPRSPLELD
jgi:acyl-CoA synthetase (NDP forming)